MKTAITIFLFFFSLTVFSQDELFPIIKNGRWGAINEDYQTIIPVKYNQITKENNVYKIKKGNKFGIFDSRGKTIIDFKYDKIDFISIQFAILHQDSFVQIYDFENKKAFKQAKKENFRVLENDIYCINLKDSLMIINILSNEIFSFAADTISISKKNNDKSSSMIDFFSSDSEFYFIGKNHKLGIVNSNFKQLTAIEFDNITIQANRFFVEKGDSHYSNNYDDGYYAVGDSNSEKTKKQPYTSGYYDYSGKIQIPCEYSRIEQKSGYYNVKKNNNWGLFNAEYKQILACEFDRINLSKYDIITAKKSTYSSAYDLTGKCLIPANKFNNLEVLSNFHLLYNRGASSGIISRNGKIINNDDFDNATLVNGLGYIVRKNHEYGFISFNGTNLVEPQFDKIDSLNSKYLRVKKNRKYGVINSSGKGIIPSKYSFIFATEHDEIFSIRSLKSEFLSGIDIQSRLKTTIPGGTSNASKEEYKWGVINSHGEILLDTIYYRQQIENDFENYALKVKQDSTMLVVNFDDDGSLIDKILYANYISFKVKNYAKEFIWKQNPRKEDNYWGLVSRRGKKVTGYVYNSISGNLLGDSALYLTTTKTKKPAISNRIKIKNKHIAVTTVKLYQRYGIVNKDKGTVNMKSRYFTINTSDFNYATIARCVNSLTKFELIDATGMRVGRKYAYVDDFQDKYTRVNYGGKLRLSITKSYNLFIPGYKNEGMAIFSGTPHNLECFGGKWGIIDANGEQIIKPIYAFLQKYYRGEFIAKKEKKWGVIYSNDSVKIDFKFDEIRYFKDKSKANEWSIADFYKIKIGKVWGVADFTGKVLIKPNYEDIELLNNDKGVFFSVKKNKLWGVISIDEKEIIPIKFTGINYLSPENKLLFRTENKKNFADFIDQKGNAVNKKYFYDAQNFKNNYAKVSFGKEEWNFIDKEFNLISDTNFVEIKNFSDNRAVVKTKTGWGFINEEGNAITSFRYNKASDFHNSRAMFEQTYPAKLFGLISSAKKQGYINKQGNIAIKAKYKKAFDFQHSVAIVMTQKKKYGLISPKGKKVLANKYRNISPFSEQGVAIVTNFKRELSVIDSLGNFIVPFGKYSQINEYKNGLACIKLGGLYGFIDETGKVVFKAQFKGASDFSENMASVKIGKRWGYIDKEKVKIPAIYRKKSDFINGSAFVNNGYQQFYIDTSGNFNKNKGGILSENMYKQINSTGLFEFYDTSNVNAFNLSFQKASNFKNGIAVVGNNKKYGLLQSDGFFKIATVTDYVSHFSENYAVYKLHIQYGLYNYKGKELAKTRFPNIESAGSKLVKITDLNKIFYIKID